MAVLMMIAIAIAGSLVVYAWTMGYIDLSTEKSEKSITVHSIANHETDLLLYVQNTGEGTVQLEEDACLYVNGVLVNCAISGVTVSDGVATIGEGETAILTFADGAVPPGEKVEVKVTPMLGGSSEKCDYPAGTAYAPSVLDHFTFDTITSPQTSGVSFRITVRAVDQYNKQFAGYSGVNTLTYSGGAISPTTTEGFVYGIWTGKVTVTGSATQATITTVSQANSSLTGISNTFDVLGEVPSATTWSKTYGGSGFDNVYSLAKTSDGGYVITGSTASFGAGGSDFWLVKTDCSGNIEWNRTYGGPENEAGYSVVQAYDGGYAITGCNTKAGTDDLDFWLVKTDAYGNMEWHKSYGGTEIDSARSLVETSDGGYALLGFTTSFGAGDCDFWFVKTDVLGNMEWNRTYGGIGEEWIHSLVKAPDGGFTFVGYTDSFDLGNNDCLLVKTDSYGNMEWNKTYGGENNDVGKALVVTLDGGYVIAGTTSSVDVGNYDFWLFKTDSLGNIE